MVFNLLNPNLKSDLFSDNFQHSSFGWLEQGVNSLVGVPSVVDPSRTNYFLPFSLVNIIDKFITESLQQLLVNMSSLFQVSLRPQTVASRASDRCLI